MNKNMLYRSIPKVDVLLEEEEIKELILRYSRETVMEAVHTEMDKLRAYIGKCEEEEEGIRRIGLLISNIRQTVEAMHTPNMRMVINGTGRSSHESGARSDWGRTYEAGSRDRDRLFESGI